MFCDLGLLLVLLFGFIVGCCFCCSLLLDLLFDIALCLVNLVWVLGLVYLIALLASVNDYFVLC